MSLYTQEPIKGCSRSQWIPAADLSKDAKSGAQGWLKLHVLISSSSQDDPSVEKRRPTSVFPSLRYVGCVLHQTRPTGKPIHQPQRSEICSSPASKPPATNQQARLLSEYSKKLQTNPFFPLLHDKDCIVSHLACGQQWIHQYPLQMAKNHRASKETSCHWFPSLQKCRWAG